MAQAVAQGAPRGVAKCADAAARAAARRLLLVPGMKKTQRKTLHLDRQTVRTLTTLQTAELEQAGGGRSWLTFCASCGPLCPGPIDGN